MTLQFLAARWASVHDVDFWLKTKSVISAVAFLKCHSPVVVPLYFHDASESRFLAVPIGRIATMQAQRSEGRTRPSSAAPVASVRGSPLRKRDSQPFGMLRFWHPHRESQHTA